MGLVEAPTRDAAVSLLSQHGLFVLSVEEGERLHWYERFTRALGRVRRKDFTIYVRQMATLMSARLSLTDALRTLRDQTAQPALVEVSNEILKDIDAGLSFSQALERHTDVFSGFFISMVRSAEITGNLEKVMGFLADYYERELALVTKARSAMVYPSIIIGLFAVVAFIMLTVVFPQIQPVFEQAGVELPWFTELLISSGTFLSAWWPILLVLLGILFIILIDYLRTDEGKALRDDLIIRLPIVKKVYLPVTMSRISNAAAMLLMGGVPVAQAIEIVGLTVSNVLYRDLLREISDRVRQGMPLAEALSEQPNYFPPLIPRMISVGEKTGQVDQMFLRVSDFYTKESENLVNNLVDLIQPVLMIAIGLLVGLLFASVLLPLYRLTSTI